MPNIIYQKNPGQLIPQGDRTISTFPSGLIRVDQTFVCDANSAASYRTSLFTGSDMPGDSPEVFDGLYVFPAPQERNRSDGFVEFIVSAFGRKDDSVNVTESIIPDNTSAFENGFTTHRKIITLKYVTRNFDLNIKYPTTRSFAYKLSTTSPDQEIALLSNDDNLISQTVTIPSYSQILDPRNWNSFYFSFIGTGTVQFYAGSNSETLQGTSAITETSATFQPFGNPIYIMPTGDVRSAVMKRTNTRPEPITLPSIWIHSDTQVVNYGIFNEVMVSYVSQF